MRLPQVEHRVRLNEGGFSSFMKFHWFVPYQTKDLGFELVTTLPARLPCAGMCLAAVESAEREPVVSGSAAVAEVRPFVVADEVAAALRSGDRAGLATEAADTDCSGSTGTSGRQSLRHHEKEIIVGSPRHAHGSSLSFRRLALVSPILSLSRCGRGILTPPRRRAFWPGGGPSCTVPDRREAAVLRRRCPPSCAPRTFSASPSARRSGSCATQV